MAALLGFLSLTLLISGTSALQCHNHSSVQPVARNKLTTELSVVPDSVITCSSGQTSCVETLLVLSTEKTDMLVTHRGCVNDSLKDGAEPTASGDQHFSIRSKVRYCQRDLCNGELTDPHIFKRPEQDKALQASDSIQCYSGFVTDSDQDILDRAECGRDSFQCYHGNATVTAGALSVDFLIKACQHPSCNGSGTQFFGAVELRLWGSCCRGAFCNGKAPHTGGPNEGDATTQTTHFASDTEDASSVPGEATVTPGRDQDTRTGSTTTRNPLYDYEEMDLFPSPGDNHDTLNPRGRNVGHRKSSLPFYPLLVAAGIAVFGIW